MVLSLVTGCSSADEPAPAKVSAPAAQEAAEEPAEPSVAPSSAPPVKVGQTATWDFLEADEYGENAKVATTFEVTAKSAEYVTSADVDTTNEPENGQYVRLTLTIKNVGQKPGEIATYGMMKWENADTAAQDAATLEEVGEGQDLDATYKPGQAVTGSLVLDVGAKGGTVSYWGGLMDETPAFTVELPKS
ncbi:hypothetical protein GCM10010298_34580 [Streptomyces microflavus]|nr:hypothetical protein GCM10010298_34580 [Streptomyces microflavus]